MFNNFTLDSYLSKIRFLGFCFACMLVLCLLFNPSAFAQVDVSITIEPSSPVVKSDETVDISGKITLSTDDETTRNSFMEETLNLIRRNPYGKYEDVIVTQPFLSENQLQYTFEDISLPDAGIWESLICYVGNDSYKGTLSASVDIEIQRVDTDTAGYAILVEGFVESESGVDSHNLTTNSIYKNFLGMGFTDEDIYYFNFDTAQDGVDKKPSGGEVLKAIKTWARGKMNASPAPLYIVFVGPGDKDKFLIYPDTIKASALAGALNSLESKLNSDASGESIVVVFGANHSGSYIDNLSKSGTRRIIIASADTEEVAYKGPLPPEETIRHGDYFVLELFNYASRGFSLKKSYEMAANQIAGFTENENSNGLNGANAGNGHYFDNSAQHPLLDDNGDGAGTNGILSSLSGEDGELSSHLIVGNKTPTSLLELTQATDIIALEAEDSGPTLYAKASDTATIDTVWIEITLPNLSLTNNKTATEQQVIDRPRFGYNTFDETEGKYLWNVFGGNGDFNNFEDAGEYEIFYFAQDKTGKITPFLDSTVFKNKIGNQPPTSFNPVYPTEGTNTAVVLTIDWEDSSDPDARGNKDDSVKYMLTISESVNFDTIQYQKKDVTDSTALVDKAAGLREGTTYYWKALASDSDGGTTLIGTTSSFMPKLLHGVPGFIKGYIFDNVTNEVLNTATITIQGLEGSYSPAKNGAYLLQLYSGKYTVSVDASGYKTVNKTLQVNAPSTTEKNIGLNVATQSASISGKIKDKKTKEPLEGVTITVEKEESTETTTSDSNGNFSITGLVSGRYKVTAGKSGYMSYQKNIKLKAGQNKKIHINLSKNK